MSSGYPRDTIAMTLAGHQEVPARSSGGTWEFCVKKVCPLVVLESRIIVKYKSCDPLEVI